jgi:putative peptidoglycan lipid II flippase
MIFMAPLQHLGPALASSVAAWANVVALVWVLHRRGHFAADAGLRRRVPRMIAAALVMVGVLYGMRHSVFVAFDTGEGNGLRWLGLVLLVGTGMAAYGLAGQALGAFDLREIAGRLARRRRKPAAVQG